LYGGTLVISDENLTAAGFLRVQSGTFTMGSPSNEAERSDWEGPQHQVTISAFYMGKYQVTQAEYEDIMGKNPSYFKGPDLPVECVSWHDAAEYCNRLSQREGLTPAYRGSGETITCDWNANGYRLPTEAEWEYACRAGMTTPFNTGNNITTSQANYNGDYPYNKNATGIYRVAPTPVGSFDPNPWGLYDMHGNVWEWCWNWYESYSSGAQTNPHGSAFGTVRVMRGGSWYSYGQVLRSAYRNCDPPSDIFIDVGFRLVRR
jgi:formylglycine-generating enzyme required for sulfatase activity